MTPERWQQVKEIFQSALERAPGERSAFLAGECGGDEALRKEVESLLASHEKDGSFIDSPAYEAAAEILAGDESELKSGRAIASYEIISFISRGGMGDVYLARDTKLNRKVALKFLPRDFTHDPERLRRFEQEARAASALNHPNILTIYEIGNAEQLRFIATEFIEGETLRERIAAGPLKVTEALHIAEQIASALAEAHSAGIIHRDIKPENIMIRRDGIVKVLDFGLAKLAPQDEIGAEDPTRQFIQTRTGAVIGTVTYMSPEQARGLPLDERSDIWSLGVVLYEMTAGRTPFTGSTRSDVMVSILEREPPSLSSFAQEAPSELERIITKALCKDREERYQTIKDLRIDVGNLAREINLTRRDGESRRVDAPSITAPQTRKRTTRQLGWRYGIAGLAVVALTFLAVAGWRSWRSSPWQNANINSLAVLPFVNNSGDSDKEYLTDGITEALINNLAQLPNLKVTNRNSVFRFKGKETDTKEIARQLGVRGIISGNVRQVEDQFVINVEFVDASDGSVILGRQYVRKVSDLLAMQSNIAQDMANNLRAKLSPQQEQLVAKQPTTNSEAYQLYLRGKSYANRSSPEGLNEGIKYYQQAIDRDPNFALAYSDMAQAYLVLGIYFQPPKEMMPQAKVYSMKSLEIDNSLVDPHLVLGMIDLVYDWDFAAAQRELTTTDGLNPKTLETFSCTAHILESTGHGKDAEAELRKALVTDPLSIDLNTELGCTSYYARQFDSSTIENRDALQLDPRNPVAYWGLARALGQKKMYAEAMDALKRSETINGSAPPLIVAEIGYVYAVEGKKEEAQNILKQLDQMSHQVYVDPYLIATIYMGLGDKEKALAWLQKSYDAKSSFMTSMKAEPKFDPLRSDGRFISILQRVGFQT